MGRSRYKIFDQAAPHFLTCTVSHWLPLFAHRDAATVVLQSLDYMHSEDRLTVWAYVLMENHLHLIASANDLSAEVGAFKSYTGHALVKLLQDTKRLSLLKRFVRTNAPDTAQPGYRVWQAGSHPKQIQGESMFRQKLAYIHMNPVKRGYVDEPEHWRYSSARDYAGEMGLIPVQLGY